jgi:hypothetical protein
MIKKIRKEFDNELFHCCGGSMYCTAEVDNFEEGVILDIERYINKIFLEIEKIIPTYEEEMEKYGCVSRDTKQEMDILRYEIQELKNKIL